jgi:glycine cleavage system aminomethyltransferase T
LRNYDFFDYWRNEHRACREGVALIDMSFMSKFLVQGHDAARCLNRLSTANVDGPNETITYTQWLNEHGTLEADLTVSKLSDDRFYVVATDTMHRHVEAHVKRHVPPNSHVTMTDVSGAYAQLNIQGPRSRELMQRLTDTDMSNAAFPFRQIREIAIGFARLLCAR